MPDARGDVAFSVVIAAYNAAETLGEQLDALARQADAPAFEVLVCDNGSSDATADVARSRAARLPGLRVVDASERRGAAAARNTGVAQARGDFVLFCDADDVVADSWVASIAHCAREHDAIAGGWDFARLNDFYEHTGPGHEPLFRLGFLPELTANGAGNLAVRRSLFESIGGFDVALRSGEDADLCIRIQLAGAELHPCPRAVVHVRLKTGLGDTARQAFGFGRADRQLRFKYAAIATQPARAPRRASALFHGAAAMRGRAGRVAAVHAASRWAGARFGRVPRELVPAAAAP